MQVPIYYTLVEHDKGDVIGFILSLFSLLPIFLIISYVTLILEKPQTIIVFGLLGQLLNEVLNSLIKKYLKMDRPFEKGRGFGMPSAHAQFMGYMIGYFFLFSVIFTRKYRIYYYGLVIGGILTAYSRVYLQYHSLDQVMIGLVLGIIVGLIFGIIFRLGQR